MHDLLTGPVIPVVTTGWDKPVGKTLPGVFSALMRDKVQAFHGLARHQRQAWYQFLAQLGAIAVSHAGTQTAPRRENEWRELLAALTPGAAETAWSLVVPNRAAPALLQPPTQRAGEGDYTVDTPDELDIVVTAKNHDRKRGQTREGPLHLWLYALVTLQTQGGFAGRGRYGIARMNGGYGSRVLVELCPGSRWGPRVERAIRMLVHHRPHVVTSVSKAPYRAQGGVALLWLEPWDTEEQLSLQQLDPYFIEVCRRVRLDAGEGKHIQATGWQSRAPRVQAEALHGHLADPWTPVLNTTEEKTALTVGQNGWDYRLVHRLLFDDNVERPVALELLQEEQEQDMELHCAVLVRGRGKTEGLHERMIRLPKAAMERLYPRAAGKGRAERMVAHAREVRRVLQKAARLYERGPSGAVVKVTGVRDALRRFDRRVDEMYCAHLFGEATIESRAEAERIWQQMLNDEAEKVMQQVWRRLSPPAARREEARRASEEAFYSGQDRWVGQRRVTGARPSVGEGRVLSG